MQVCVFQCDCAGMPVPQRLEALQNAINANPCDVIILPELFLSGYNVGDKLRNFAMEDDSPLHDWMAKLARATGTGILYSFPERAGDLLFNAARLIDQNGQSIQHHRKICIPPGNERDYFTRGNGSEVFDYCGMKCAILICYDVEFPENVRKAALSGAEVIFAPTALGQDWGVVADHLIPTRAFENGVWVVYANHAGTEDGLTYYGHSVIASPVGADSARAGAGPEAITATLDSNTVQKAQLRLPYLAECKSL